MRQRHRQHRALLEILTRLDEMAAARKRVDELAMFVGDESAELGELQRSVDKAGSRVTVAATEHGIKEQEMPAAIHQREVAERELDPATRRADLAAALRRELPAYLNRKRFSTFRNPQLGFGIASLPWYPPFPCFSWPE